MLTAANLQLFAYKFANISTFIKSFASVTSVLQPNDTLKGTSGNTREAKLLMQIQT